MEAIDFQLDSALGSDLSAIITDIRTWRKLNDKVLNTSPLSDVIRKHTGLNVTVKTANGYGAYVFVPDIDKNNPVVNRWRRNYLSNEDSDAMLRKSKAIKGIVNISKGKVSGDFSDIAITIHLGISYLQTGGSLTVEESAAILMHEIGHCMSYLELLGRSVTTNYVLQEATKRLLNCGDKEQKYVIIKNIEEASDIRISDKQALANANSKHDITLIIVSDAIRNTPSEMGNNVYDERGFEQLADQYVSRMGYGRHLATGLDTLLSTHGHPDYLHPVAYYFLQVINVIYTPIVIPFVVIFSINPYEPEYDEPKKRLEAMRTDSIRLLKHPKITSDRKAQVLADIDHLDKVIANVKERAGYYGWIWDNLIPTGRRNRRSMDMQQKLEELSSSKLNVSVARLEQLL
jgi:hypothetical protein